MTAAAYNRQWQIDNKDKTNAKSKKWNAANRKAINDRRCLRYKTDLEFQIAYKLRRRLQTALKAQGASRGGSAVKDLGCTVAQLRFHLEAQFQPGMTWANRSQWHIDHKKPLAVFDLKDPAQLREACHYSNLQPLWAADNLRKGGRDASLSLQV